MNNRPGNVKIVPQRWRIKLSRRYLLLETSTSILTCATGLWSTHQFCFLQGWHLIVPSTAGVTRTSSWDAIPFFETTSVKMGLHRSNRRSPWFSGWVTPRIVRSVGMIASDSSKPDDLPYNLSISDEDGKDSGQATVTLDLIKNNRLLHFTQRSAFFPGQQLLSNSCLFRISNMIRPQTRKGKWNQTGLPQQTRNPGFLWIG